MTETPGTYSAAVSAFTQEIELDSPPMEILDLSVHVCVLILDGLQFGEYESAYYCREANEHIALQVFFITNRY